MGCLEKIATIVTSNLNSLLNGLEDPDKIMELSLDKQKEMSTKLKKAIVTIQTQIGNLDKQGKMLEKSIDDQDEKIKFFASQGNEDVGKRAVATKLEFVQQLTAIKADLETLRTEKGRLKKADEEVMNNIRSFAIKKETLKARRSAAEAKNYALESITGIGDGGNVTRAVERAEDKNNELESKAAALDTLIDEGVLQGFKDTKIDPADVDAEWARVKASKIQKNELVD
jgi:phage shock protein A